MFHKKCPPCQGNRVFRAGAKTNNIDQNEKVLTSVHREASRAQHTTKKALSEEKANFSIVRGGRDP